MERTINTRREFLKQASIALALPLVLSCRTDSPAQISDNKIIETLRSNAIADPGCSWCGARGVPATVSWRTKLATEADKGERILISGTVYKADAKTAAANTLIYFYHTDVYGIYGRDGEHRHGRYRGWMLTDERGRYEFETILPASYPNSTIAKHIHMTLTTADQKEDSIDSILFEGDRFLTASERVVKPGGFNHVMKLTKDLNGVGRAVRDIRLG